MTATPAFETAFAYVALHVLFLMALAILVVRQRFRSKVAIGDGGNAKLIQAQRIHGNAVEQAAATFALIIGFAVLAAPLWAIHLFGVATLAGRVFHAAGMAKSTGPTLGRQAGMMLTWTAQGVGALAMLALIAL